MYIMSLSIHNTISPVRTYRRCALDIWSTWRLLFWSSFFSFLTSLASGDAMGNMGSKGV
jgi:hypothetical protein